MHCTKAVRWLQRSIDKQLETEQLAALEAHLAGCNSCRQNALLYKEMINILERTPLIAEPVDLTANVMRRVANQQQMEKIRSEQKAYRAAFRPLLPELCAAGLLATFAMLGIIWEQPTLRAAFPIVNSYTSIAQFCGHTWNALLSTNSNTLLLACWIIGTLLGIWITLTLVGAEMRSAWLHAVMDRLPVW